MKNVLTNVTERDVAKKKFLAWFYNPNSDSIKSDHYDRKLLLKKYYRDGFVRTPFGRRIQANDFHALNYLLQSSSSDNCMKQAIKIHRFIKNKKSFIDGFALPLTLPITKVVVLVPSSKEVVLFILSTFPNSCGEKPRSNPP